MEITQLIKIKTDIKDEKLAERLCDYLIEEFPTSEWENYWDRDSITIDGVEKGKSYYTPARRYLPNGDPGYPEDYYDTLEVYEGDVENTIQHFVVENNEDFDWSVTTDSECFREDY